MSISRNLSIFADTVATSGNAVSSVTIPVLNGSSTLALQTGGTTGLYLDASQNVGIGTNSPAAKLDIGSGNLNFSSTAQRITGDFSNATLASRVMFQTSTANSNTGLGVITNGTGNSTGMRFFNGSDSANASALFIGSNATDAYLQSIITGTGTYLPLTIYTSGSERMRIDTSGNVGIGTTGPTYNLDIRTGVATSGLRLGNTGNAFGLVNQWDNSNGYGNIFTLGSYGLLFGTNSTERMRIDTSGNLLVGTTSTQNNARLRVFGASTSGLNYTLLVEGSGGADNFYVRDDGEMYSLPTYNRTSASASNVGIDSAGGFFRSTSSLKYKTDVQDATHGLAEVMQLRPVTYKGKSENDGETVFGGLIAEEVHAAGLTEFVQYAEDGSPDALAYGNMVSLCIKAIQELSAEVTALKAKVGA